jgi:predicted dehydrogenase
MRRVSATRPFVPSYPRHTNHCHFLRQRHNIPIPPVRRPAFEFGDHLELAVRNSFREQSFLSLPRILSLMLQVGLIGLGPEWQQRFRPALERLHKRIAVRSVYATVASQAEQAAAELKCEAAPGIVALIEREDVRAVLVLETDWHAGVPAYVACQLGKPAFLAGRLACRLSAADLQRQAADAGVTLMPGLGHRYTPATSRLKELIATRLGRPLQIEIDAGPGDCGRSNGSANQVTIQEPFAAAIDWCISLVGTMPAGVQPISRNGSAVETHSLQQFDVEFRRSSAGGEPARARIEVHSELPTTSPDAGTSLGPVLPRIRIRCAKGNAVLEPPCGITWEVDGCSVTESLTADRPDVEVMLDHFTRRVLGGLIPVPTLEDVLRARALADMLPV